MIQYSHFNVRILFIDRKRETKDGEEYAFAVITPDADEVTIQMNDKDKTNQRKTMIFITQSPVLLKIVVNTCTNV